ncbi:putative mitochondrial protein AtMg00860 [Araneus ventricosus]|uniref:Putative mitochondrial protein AtMg00860 n=1 Tax=Araneus ventricosus TaxID=182803 RepID=A0A4Y2N973_ARAVE|nr:putative mitochondrial protein AtMg00860 [Araneus ventricosus]
MAVRKLVKEFQNLFSTCDTDVGRCNMTQHRINTGDHPPIKQYPRRLHLSKKDKAELLVKEMVDNGIIGESSGSWTSPIVLVKKEGGSTQSCVDCRKLNKITKKGQLSSTRNRRHPGCFESGYWQVEIGPEDREKTAFTTGQGLWQFKEVAYLGYVISAEGVKTDPEKIKAVVDWRHPETVHNLQSFLGLCTYYRRLVKNFSTIARPVHKLTEAKSNFKWTEECQKSFNGLKQAFTSSPILIYLRTDKDFILDTNTSNEGGAMLHKSDFIGIVFVPTLKNGVENATLAEPEKNLKQELKGTCSTIMWVHYSKELLWISWDLSL